MFQHIGWKEGYHVPNLDCLELSSSGSWRLPQGYRRQPATPRRIGLLRSPWVSFGLLCGCARAWWILAYPWHFMVWHRGELSLPALTFPNLPTCPTCPVCPPFLTCPTSLTCPTCPDLPDLPGLPDLPDLP